VASLWEATSETGVLNPLQRDTEGIPQPQQEDCNTAPQKRDITSGKKRGGPSEPPLGCLRSVLFV
jgi:hypothetical protein